MHGCGSIVLPPYGFTTRPVFLRVNCSPFACSFPENIIMHAQRLAFPCVNCCRLRRVDRSIDFKQEENWSAKAGEEDGSRSGVASAVLVLPPAWCLPAARSGLWSPNQSPPSPSLQIPPHVSHIFFARFLSSLALAPSVSATPFFLTCGDWRRALLPCRDVNGIAIRCKQASAPGRARLVRAARPASGWTSDGCSRCCHASPLDGWTQGVAVTGATNKAWWTVAAQAIAHRGCSIPSQRHSIFPGFSATSFGWFGAAPPLAIRAGGRPDVRCDALPYTSTPLRGEKKWIITVYLFITFIYFWNLWGGWLCRMTRVSGGCKGWNVCGS